MELLKIRYYFNQLCSFCLFYNTADVKKRSKAPRAPAFSTAVEQEQEVCRGI